MNHLVACAFMPHPPIMVPEVGQAHRTAIAATVEAAVQTAARLKEAGPQTVVIITPHGAALKDAVTISIHPRLAGNFAAFGVPDLSLGFETDGLLSRQIVKQARRLGTNLVEMTDDLAKNYRLSLRLDHGALVPLYYLQKAGFKGQMVHLTVGFLPYEEMYTFGKAVQVAIAQAGRNTAVIASGDLSHRLTPGAPAGYEPTAADFDEQMMAALGAANVKALFAISPELTEAAGECGLRPAYFLLGVMGGMEVQPEVLSYEGPFGVGYGVVHYRVRGKKGGN